MDQERPLLANPNRNPGTAPREAPQNLYPSRTMAWKGLMTAVGAAQVEGGAGVNGDAPLAGVSARREGPGASAAAAVAVLAVAAAAP